MANFKKTLSDPQTSFSRVTPRRPADTSSERDQILANVATVAAGAAGKAFAQKSGADLAGADVSLEQANDEAAVIEQKINASLVSEQNNVAGPLQPQRVEELKDAQLSSFADNDRTLIALRDRGVISSSEARARRTMNLRRAVSNPINNLFRRDFLNAAGDLTGGAGGAVDAAFGDTPAEKEAIAISQAQQKAKVDFEQEVTERELRTGKTRDVVVSEMEQQAQDQSRVETLNRLKTERELNGLEKEELFARSRSGVGRGNSALISEFNMANGGNGLGAPQMAQVTQSVEQQYQELVNNLNNTPGLLGSDRDAELARIDKWKSGQLALVKAYDSAEIDKKQLEQFDIVAQKVGWAHAGEVMALKAIDPKLFDVFLKSAGNLDVIMNQTLGGERGTHFVDAAKMIGSFGQLSQGQPIDDKEAVATMLTSQAGVQYVAEEAGNPNSNVSEGLKAAYAEATETSLKSFTSGISQMQAKASAPYRGEVSNAMEIGRRKFLFMQDTKGGGGRIEARQEGTIGRNKRPRIVLNLPEGMTENAGELKQLWNVINKQPWTWEHVEDEYLDTSDAFNGYLRGEWQVNLEEPGLISKGKLTRRGRRIEAEAPVEATKLSPIEGDVAELQELLAAEEAGAPTDEQEARLTELLEQRVAIRDQKRTGGKPVDPRPDLPEKQPFQVTGRASFEEKLKSFENNKSLPESRSGFDGTVWRPHKSVEGGSDTLAYGHKLTPAEVKSGTVKVGGQDVDYKEGITDAQAEDLFRQDVDVHRNIVSKAYPNLEGKAAEALTMMVFQGANVTKWKNSNAAIKKAIKSDDDADWLSAQAHILNSKWATEQTPDRALETVHLLFPDTPIETLESLLAGFQKKRGVKNA